MFGSVASGQRHWNQRTGWRDRAICLAVVSRYTMTRVGYESEELRTAEQEVEDLWDEEEQHRLAEVAQDADGGKDHPAK